MLKGHILLAIKHSGVLFIMLADVTVLTVVAIFAHHTVFMLKSVNLDCFVFSRKGYSI